MQKEINFYHEMASEHRLQEYSKGIPLFLMENLCLHHVSVHTKFCIYIKFFLNFLLFTVLFYKLKGKLSIFTLSHMFT